ncbi:MAG: hypothetical protein NZL85_00675, partial [Fimbriimonadales bacterium]|nr:hypothetical protein [Fimbriimonadales bacterium]
MRRVTLVNAWHDDNKGDSAIVIGTLRVLREVLGEQARFALVAAAGELATRWGLTGWDSAEPV